MLNKSYDLSKFRAAKSVCMLKTNGIQPHLSHTCIALNMHMRRLVQPVVSIEEKAVGAAISFRYNSWHGVIDDDG